MNAKKNYLDYYRVRFNYSFVSSHKSKLSNSILANDMTDSETNLRNIKELLYTSLKSFCNSRNSKISFASIKICKNQ